MKKIIICLLLFSIYSNSHSQHKDNLNLLRLNLSEDSIKYIHFDEYKLNINDYVFVIDDKDFKFENNKLSEYSYKAYSTPYLEKFNNYSVTLLLESIQDYFLSHQYKIIYKNDYYPTPKLMLGEKAVIIYYKDGIYIILNIPSCILYGNTNIYELKLIVTKQYSKTIL